MPSVPPRVLTIAGSDSGGGAGIQADLKTFAAHRVYGMSVVTAVTAQNTVRVSAVAAMDPGLVASQLEAVLEDVGADAVKIGMLANAEIVLAVVAALRKHRPASVVLDPVMISKSGAALLQDDAVEALTAELLPLATLITPNLPEAERMTGLPVTSVADRRRVAQELLDHVNHGPAVLIKGGHGEGSQLVDLLVTPEGTERQFEHTRIETTSTHGTGCTLSSAIAARLGHGETLEAAVGGAISYLNGAIAAAYPIGSGHGPVDHLYRLG